MYYHLKCFDQWIAALRIVLEDLKRAFEEIFLHQLPIDCLKYSLMLALIMLEVIRLWLLLLYHQVYEHSFEYKRVFARLEQIHVIHVPDQGERLGSVHNCPTARVPLLPRLLLFIAWFGTMAAISLFLCPQFLLLENCQGLQDLHIAFVGVAELAGV